MKAELETNMQQSSLHVHSYSVYRRLDVYHLSTLHRCHSCHFRSMQVSREESRIMWRFPNWGKCIISFQEVLRSELKNVRH